MSITLQTLTGQINGDTLELEQGSQSLPTTPLAEVPSGSSPESVIVVEGGAVRQVAVDDLAKMETFHYTSWTENGIDYQVGRTGNVVELSASSGSLTSAFGANEAFGTIPSDYRPRYMTVQAWDASRASRLLIATNGNITSTVALSLGAYIRFTATYICQ